METTEIEQVYRQDVAEKKTTARGARYRASRTGKVGKMNLPADFLGHMYTKGSPTVSFSVEDVLYMLQETPTLKDLLMERLDAEYQHYKLAIDRTLDAVARIQAQALSSILDRIDVLESKVSTAQGANKSAPASPRGRRNRCPEDIREHVFIRVDEALGSISPSELDFKSVTAFFPGIRYYIYQLKVWPGFREMLEDFWHWKALHAGNEQPADEGTFSIEPNQAEPSQIEFTQ